MKCDVIFNIGASRNVYEPCPKCNATSGMGITSRAKHLFVRCDCGHEGPHIEIPSTEQYLTWPVPWHERDRLAFEGWNEAAKVARASLPPDNPETGNPL